MELWMIFAFISPLLWAVTNVIDKFLIDKHMKEPYSASIYLNVIYFVIGLSLVFFVDLVFPVLYIMLAFVVGLFMFISFLLYFKSVSEEDVSIVAPLIFVYPIFTMLFAFMFLGEVISFIQYVGAFFLVASSILISVKKDFGKIVMSPALRYMMVSNIMIGAGVVIEKFILSTMNFWALVFWTNAGIMAASVFALAVSRGTRREFRKLLKLRPTIVGVAWLVNIFAITAMLCFYFALSSGPASLVSSINAVQPFYVLVFVALLSVFMPRILKEVHTKRTLFLKILAIMAVFLGTYLIAL